MIPITQITIDNRARTLVSEVLDSGQLAQGAMVGEFEKLIRNIVGSDHAVALNSGTAALIGSLRALNIGPGDEVITSPLTFAATLNAILEAGATARFADIGADYNLRIDAVKSLINPRTAAILPVHLYGLMADVHGLGELARASGLGLVEDAAQAIGASSHAVPAGKTGIGCFSFYATKNVTTGEGGAVTTDDPAVADFVRTLRNQGMKARYEYEFPGQNLRMTDVHAAIGIPQLERLDDITASRRRNAGLLTDRLDGLEGIYLPTEPANHVHVFHQYTVQLTSDAPVDRDVFVARLHAAGIGAAVYYPRLVFDYPCYAEDPRVRSDDLVTTAFEASRRVASLPVHPGLSEDDIDRIGEAVTDALTG